MQRSLWIPRQPFMVMLGNTYYKKVINQYGISHFYSCVVEKGVTEISTSLPDCCVDLMFYWDKDQRKYGADIVGSTLIPHCIQIKEGCEYFGVRFMPGEMPCFLNIWMGEVMDSTVPLEQHLTNSDIIERIVAAQGFQERIGIFLKYYISHYKMCEKPYGKKELNQYLLTKILSSQGNIRIAGVAEETGYSKQYVTKVFTEFNRISPKYFSEIIRFQTMVQQMESEQNMKLYYELGFYDQSHFCNEFKKFSHRSPMEFIEELKEENFSERLKVVE